jgi:molybdopterin-guanine dinucleotide biosynthesis protein A
MNAAGYVLAGGRSSRMGSEKALVEFAGEPLVVHALRTLRRAGLTASIAGARSPLECFAPVVTDSEPDMGPLGGICAALASSKARRAVFLPVDLPLLPSALVTMLMHEAQDEGTAVTVAAVNGFTQTFPAVVDRAALPWLRSALESGRGGCFAAFQGAAEGLNKSMKVVPVERALQEWESALREALPVECWFLNVNAPADLLRAEASLAASARRPTVRG